MNLEEAIRTTVREMADDAPPAKGLAPAARRRGRRLRRRRRATAALALAMIAVILSASLVPRHQRPDRLPPATVEPTQVDPTNWWKSPYPLPGGAIVTALSRRNVGGSEPGGGTVRDGNVLLNRTTGQYVVLPASYYTIFGAPVGERAVASNGEGGSGIVDASGGRGVWRDRDITPDWSADGSRVLFGTGTGYAVMDVATGTSTPHDTPDAVALCPDVCRFSWLPGEREVAVAQRDPAVEQSENKPDTIKNIAIFDVATAKRLRTVPVAGVPVRQDAWSPDGTLVLLEDQPGRAHPVAEVATGRIVTWLPVSDPHFLPSGQILAFSNLEAVLFDTGGASLAIQGLPYDFTDREISIGQP